VKGKKSEQADSACTTKNGEAPPKMQNRVAGIPINGVKKYGTWTQGKVFSFGYGKHQGFLLKISEFWEPSNKSVAQKTPPFGAIEGIAWKIQ